MRLSIFYRLLMGYLGVFVSVMAMSLYVIHQIGQFNEVTRSVLMTDTRLINQKEKLTDAILSQIRYERKFIITKDEAFYAQFLKYKADFESYLQEVMSMDNTPRTRSFLEHARQYHQRYHRLLDEELKSLRMGRSYPQKWYQQEKGRVTDGIIEELENLKSHSLHDVYAKISYLNKATAKSRRVVMGITGIFLMFGILISLFLNRSITQPISILKKKTREIAKGDFDSNLNLSSPPELGELATAFNLMCYRLKDLDRMKSEFFSIMSHELRTPLTSIKEGIALLKDGVGGPLQDKQKNLLSILSEESYRLIGIVNSLLDLSKMEAGMTNYAFEEANLGPLIDRAIVEVKPLVEVKKITLETKIDEKLPPAKIDRERMLQALRNLIGNALKFTPDGGRVRIIARSVDQGLEVSVVDTGPGIPKENLKSIFEKFRQAPVKDQGQIKGTGLGLAIVKHIITAHGGRVWAESEPGQGSSFVFVLPA